MSPEAKRWRIQDEINWRRHLVMQYLASGYNQAEIAQKLQKATATISRDVSYLQQQAKQNYKSHIEEKIPFEVEQTLALFKKIKKQAIEIAENAPNERIKIAALALAKDAGKEAIELQMQGEYVERAIKIATTQNTLLQELDTITATTPITEEELRAEGEQQKEEEEEYDPEAKF